MKNKRLTWLFGFLLVMPPTTRYIPFGADIGGLTFGLPRISMLACAVFATITLIRRPQLKLSYADVGILLLLMLLILSCAWSIAPNESVPLCIAGCLIGLLATALTGMFNIVITQSLFYLPVGVGSSTVIMSKSKP